MISRRSSKTESRADSVTRARNAPRQRRARGTGTVYERKDGRHEGRWRAPLNGKGQRDEVVVYGQSRIEADEALSAAIADYKSGARRPAKSIRLADWLETWLVLKVQQGRKYKTLRAYEQSVDLLIPRLGKFEVARIKSAHVRKAIDDIVAKSGAASGRNAHNVLRNALNHEDLAEVLLVNPCYRIKAPTSVRNPGTPWSLGEARAFLAAIDGTRLEALWLLEAENGPRPCESIGIEWSKVDLDRRTITIDAEIIWTAGGIPTWETPKSEKGNRTIAVSERIAAALRRRKITQAAERERAGSEWLDNDFVFAMPNGRPLRGDSLNKMFQRACARAGVRPTRLYDTRRLSASAMLAAGRSLAEVQYNHGHSDSQLVANTYGYGQHESLQAASAATSALFAMGPADALHYPDEAGERGDRPSDRPSIAPRERDEPVIHARKSA
jgi:integrase